MNTAGREIKASLLAWLKDQWIAAEQTDVAFSRDYESQKKIAQLFQWVSFVSALLTAASTALPWKLLTVLSALVTAGVAGAEKAWNPIKRSSKTRAARGKLYAVKVDLNNFATSIDLADDIPDAQKAIQEFAKRITDVVTADSANISITQEDKKEASTAFLDTSICRILARYTSADVGAYTSSDIDELPEEIPADAPGLVQVFIPSERIQ